MADNRYVRDEVYFANFENNTTITDPNAADYNATPEEAAEYAIANENGLGYYQFVTLDEMINNYMAVETDEGMVAEGAKRSLVEFHAQRAIQELSYDTLTGLGTLEYQLDGSLSIPIPQNAVSITKVSWVDTNGNLHPIRQRRFSGDPTALLQDDSGAFVYDDNGKAIGVSNETRERYEDASRGVKNTDQSGFFGENFFEGHGPYGDNQGRRFGSEPEVMHLNGTYVYNEEDGVIYVDSTLSESYVVVEYVSDGLHQDFKKVKVHKHAEEAVYDYITWKVTRARKELANYIKNDAKKQWFGSKRNTKHRLSPISPVEIFGVMRNQSKNIKH